MWRWLPAAISALALLMGCWNAFAMWRLGGRLTAFERMAIFLRGDDDQVRLAAYRDRGPDNAAVGEALRATFPQPLANTPMRLAFEHQRALFFGDVANNPDAPESR